ncbi:hypothetical protein LXA43DRAFT_1010342 [Ganoderma leucocontextum]|nr:hypothetical protein LXA43DRAFT_1010342 [Ganoderma leucocontextum]
MFGKLTPSSLVYAFAFLAFYLQLVLGAAIAAPRAAEEKRDVYVPPVLYPHNGTVWTIGQRHNVTWYVVCLPARSMIGDWPFHSFFLCRDVSDPPVNITNSRGLILLRKGNLATPLILQNGFDILLGRIEITVPWVVDGSDYSIVRAYLPPPTYRLWMPDVDVH